MEGGENKKRENTKEKTGWGGGGERERENVCV